MTYREFADALKDATSYVVELTQQRDILREHSYTQDATIRECRDGIKQLQTTILELTQRADRWQEECDDKHKQLEHEIAQHNITARQLVLERNMVDSLCARIEKLERARVDADSLNATNCELAAQLNGVRNELQHERATNESATVSYLRKMLEGTTATLRVVRNDLESSHADRDLLQTMLDDARRARDDAERLAKGYADRWIDQIIGGK